MERARTWLGNGLRFPVSILLMGLISACGDDGDPGAPGISCWDLNADGVADLLTEDRNLDGVVDVLDCQVGTGNEGEEGVEVTRFHGTDVLLSSGEYAPCPPGVTTGCGKFFATITIAGATANREGVATVDFTVEDEKGNPITGFDATAPGWRSDLQFAIAKLEPASEGRNYNLWRPYIYTTITVPNQPGPWPNPAGTSSDMGTSEDVENNPGGFTNHGDGSYTYEFAVDLSDVTANGAEVVYDRGVLHRVAVFTGGHEGPTDDAFFDFVPDGGPAPETRDIVPTSVCYDCHGENEFHGHGGDRLQVETCNMCHNQAYNSPYNDESLSMAVMIHKIHAGGEVASIAGPDGIVWDNPATPVDESADNGEYVIYRNFRGRVNAYEWWNVEFPAVIENCTKCHTGGGADQDNWKLVPSRDACGSCHDDVVWEDGTQHSGGPQASDEFCTLCHKSTGTEGAGPSVTEAHNWMVKDPRNIPEFDVELAVSEPANGAYFVAGEQPVVSIVMKENGTPIDHRTVYQDSSAEGCVSDPCPPRDGMFRNAYLFVHGPRARNNPVLGTVARAEVVGAGGPYDLTGAQNLALVVDGGKDIFKKNALGRDAERIAAKINVAVAANAFAAIDAATDEEIVDWLNANADFADRAIAYIDEASGNAAVRSRNLGDFFSMQLLASGVADVVFGGDTARKVVGGFYPSNFFYRHANPAEDDPKAAWERDRITYTLDPVDDLEPGTYVASVEIADRGRINATNYKTPSVGKVSFQVGVADEEYAVAGSCDQCHQGPDGTGFVLDFSRHYKIFDATAIDQCANCHDYQSQNATGAWEGGRPISKRVHAVHHGSELNYPNTTVDYTADPVAGRSWDIEFPQDIRNCDTTCHPPATTSGSWAYNPSRLPCSGCHDSDSATAHMNLMTWDPTPDSPWSGDEAESCRTCH